MSETSPKKSKGLVELHRCLHPLNLVRAQSTPIGVFATHPRVIPEFFSTDTEATGDVFGRDYSHP